MHTLSGLVPEQAPESWLVVKRCFLNLLQLLELCLLVAPFHLWFKSALVVSHEPLDALHTFHDCLDASGEEFWLDRGRIDL